MDSFKLDRDHVPSLSKEREPSDLKEKGSTLPSTAETPRRQNGQLRVLVVEDDKVNSALMQKRLNKWNHIFVAVENGREAKDVIARDFDFDCVMMDLQMPIMDGYQATSAIREFEELRRIPATLLSHQCNGRMPIFAVSASLTEDQREDLWELGIDGWLLKPIVWDRVRDLINGITDVEQRRKDMYIPGHWERGGWLGWNEGNGPF